MHKLVTVYMTTDSHQQIFTIVTLIKIRLTTHQSLSVSSCHIDGDHKCDNDRDR